MNIIHKQLTIVLIVILFSITIPGKLHATLLLDPPQITCISVLETGEIEISWNSLDTSVDEFNIYYSTDAQNWTPSGTVVGTNSQFQYIISDPNVNANNQRYYIYISATYGSQIINSEIFSTMFLVADNTADGIATLIWNNLGSPQPAGSDDTYSIYYSIFKNGQAGNWNFITGDATNTSYNFRIPDGICNDTINFKIELGNSFGCTSTSNIAGNWFSEDNYPEVPLFDSVSVFNNSYVILGWKPSVSIDVMGTIIYRYESGTFNEIDTVFDNTISHYIDSSYNTCGLNYNYAIAAMDSCGKPSVGSFDSAQRVIILNEIENDLCSSSNYLSWFGYINANPDLEKYEVWASVNGIDFEIVGETDSQTTYFTHEDIQFATNYSYKIKAIFGGFSSTSCIANITTGTYTVPNNLYLANSSVLVDNSIDLTIDLDLYPIACQWKVLRSEPGGGNFSEIHSFTRNDVSQSLYDFNDTDANGSAGFYQYYLEVYDSCGNLAITSNEQTTIYLEGEYSPDEVVNLKWTPFSGFDGGVEKYYINRYTMNNYPGEIIDSVDAQTLQFSDDISAIDKSVTTFNYYISAKEGNNNTYNYREISTSNIVSLYRETEIYMPNAFRPKGVNNIFKPVTAGFTGHNYLFQIFNRWGQLIFKTEDPQEGWDGTYQGNYVQQGTYIYKITYSSIFEKPIFKEGTVTLID